MEFTTPIKIPKAPFDINHTDGIVLSGSCFTENIGHNLQESHFKVNLNPFGIIYHPLAVFNSIQQSAVCAQYKAEDIWQHDGLYVSLDHHGCFSGLDVNVVIQHINESIKEAAAVFASAKYIILTLGTAWTYKHLPTQKTVANCHKIPNTQFEKSILSIPQITTAFDEIYPLIQDKIILFTVSPVRHWRDGAIENQRSKSILIESIHQITTKHPNCHYFPAYEIMMDELRDYRFYAEDMLHPNSVAVQYIWEKFSDIYFSEYTRQANKELAKIRAMQQHRVLHKERTSYAILQEKLEEKKAIFRQTFPEIKID